MMMGKMVVCVCGGAECPQQTLHGGEGTQGGPPEERVPVLGSLVGTGQRCPLAGAGDSRPGVPHLRAVTRGTFPFL